MMTARVILLCVASAALVVCAGSPSAAVDDLPLCCTAESAGSDDADGETDEWIPLFDGESFEGWDGDLSVFRIEDNAIVGGQTQEPIPHNVFLATKHEYADFELQLEFRLVGENTNAGIQLRSRRIPDHHEMIGYQADLGQQYWGSLYDESRRRVILAKADPDVIRQVLKPNDWNRYRMVCQGRRIQLWINDAQTVDYDETDESLEQTGLIALQIHGGPPGEAWYRKIRLRKLPAAE